MWEAFSFTCSNISFSMSWPDVTFTLIQPSDSAILAMAVNRTVFPVPLGPEKIQDLFGSPGLFLRPSRISNMMSSLPAIETGMLPKVGRKGFFFSCFGITMSLTFMQFHFLSHFFIFFHLHNNIGKKILQRMSTYTTYS